MNEVRNDDEVNVNRINLMKSSIELIHSISHPDIHFQSYTEKKLSPNPDPV